MGDEVRIGCWTAFWGDTPHALGQLLGEELDYLVADHLAEITLALLARARAERPGGGYVEDAVRALAPRLAEIQERGIKLVTNAGGLAPRACAQALTAAAADAGLALRVVAVEGDDLIAALPELLAGQPRDAFTGEQLPSKPIAANAYLGARPIAAALDAGADVVVTGRCADAAVVLGPLMHEFGWGDGDHDLLAAGTLTGHILECGPQCAGGLFTDWAEVPGWEDIGYPIAECRADGSATIAKPAGTGGLITPATVAEQILYEIGDPGAYVTPDVVCDWREVELEQGGVDRVAVRGARGRAPTATYKATAMCANGYRALASAMVAGFDAAAKARRAGEAIVARAERLAAEAGFGPFAESSVEVVGSGDIFGIPTRPDAAVEAVVKVGVRHRERDAVRLFAGEYAPIGLVAQGIAGMFGGRPRVAPAIEVYGLLVDKSSLSPRLWLDGEEVAVAVAPGSPEPVAASPRLAEPPTTAASPRPEQTYTVPLHRLAYGRSGDKGNLANIGLIARRPEFVPLIQAQVSAAVVAAFFAHHLGAGAEVARWEVPGFDAVNIVIPDVLGGHGGTSTLRFDPQGKAYAAMLLTLPIAIPRGWEHERLLWGTPAG
ncbi:MAG: acyclic terpene utilization AtuA family protein [Solirubrobacterales bacterium]